MFFILKKIKFTKPPNFAVSPSGNAAQTNRLYCINYSIPDKWQSHTPPYIIQPPTWQVNASRSGGVSVPFPIMQAEMSQPLSEWPLDLLAFYFSVLRIRVRIAIVDSKVTYQECVIRSCIVSAFTLILSYLKKLNFKDNHKMLSYKIYND